MKINSINQATFGWKDVTHKKITETALKERTELKPYESDLAKFAQQPDFDETGFYSNLHFYYPFAQQKSFYDPSGKDNAYGRYTYHADKMKKAINDKDPTAACEHAGRALHFLQDVSEQHHSHAGSMSEKATEQKVHIEFENFVQNNQEKMFPLLKPQNPQKYDDFDDLFIKTANYSATSDFATEENKNKWDDIAKDGLSNSLVTTKMFLDKFNSLILEKS